MLYAGERRACFIESLANFRPGLADVAWSGSVPLEWFSTRRIARFSLLEPTWCAIDLRAAETIQSLRTELRGFLSDRGYGDLDMSDALGHDLVLTQAISAWAHDLGFRGIVYSSRLALDMVCVAIFELAIFAEVQIAEIDRQDPDVRWAADALGLRLPE